MNSRFIITGILLLLLLLCPNRMECYGKRPVIGNNPFPVGLPPKSVSSQSREVKRNTYNVYPAPYINYPPYGSYYPLYSPYSVRPPVNYYPYGVYDPYAPYYSGGVFLVPQEEPLNEINAHSVREYNASVLRMLRSVSDPNKRSEFIAAVKFMEELGVKTNRTYAQAVHKKNVDQYIRVAKSYAYTLKRQARFSQLKRESE